MTLRLPGERGFKMLSRRLEDHVRLHAVLELGPKAVYSGLQWMQREGNLNPKLPLAVFRSIYGAWPRPQDKGEPEPPAPALQEWFFNRPKKSKARR